jgi:type VI secretion system protein VasG
MVTRDLRKLLERLDAHLTRVVGDAVSFANARTHYEVTLEHVFVKLLEDGGGDVPRIFRHFGVDDGRVWDALLGRLELVRSGNTGHPVFSPTLWQLLESAWVGASLQHSFAEVRSGNVLEAVLGSEALRLEPWVDPLAAIREDELRADFLNIVAGSEEDRAPVDARASRAVAGANLAASDKRETALDLYTVALTARARAGEIDPVFGRDAEIRQIIDILSRRRKNNPVLVGEAGVGKTAVVEGLALRIAQRDVPENLRDVEIHTLDLGLLQAGAGVKGEFEQRLKSVIQEVRSSPTPIVLFIDEAHTLIGAGGAAGTSDAANLLKPALARGELRTIAATTWSEYKKYFEKDAALERRFQLVKIEEPTIETATTMLRGIKAIYEKHHGVQIPDDAVAAAVQLSARFISGRQLPDKAVDLLDTASARVRMAQTARPAALDDVERRINDAAIRLTALERDEVSGLLQDSAELAHLRSTMTELVIQRAALTTRWEVENRVARQVIDARRRLMETTFLRKGDALPYQAELERLEGELALLQRGQPMVFTEVGADITAQVVADWTGIPAGQMLKDDVARLIELDDRLKERVLGQPEAIAELADTLRVGKAGIANPEAPLGVFMLIGPSGVGKTECARAIADQLFGGDRFLITINMSEYQEAHTVAQLKGSPPGYVGYGEGGVLTEAVRQHPYSVVLLDEVEKAHRDVMNLFYQVFDKGFMRDGEGREIDFKNTVIVMTSNIGSDEMLQVCGAGEAEAERPTPDQMREMSRLLLMKQFAPALLARMRIVPFYPLTRSIMRDIVRVKLDRVGQRVAKAHRVAFRFDEAVVDWIATRCTEVESGARNVDSIIDRTILPEASRALLVRAAGPDADRGAMLTLGLNDAGFTYTFSDTVPPITKSESPFEASRVDEQLLIPVG